MNTTILNKEQVTSIKKAIAIVKPKSIILPTLECVLIINGDLILTDLKHFIRIKNIGIDGEFIINAKEFVSFVSLMPEFSTVLEKGKVSFISPDQLENFSYKTEAAGDFPLIPELSWANCGVINGDDYRIIVQAVQFTSNDVLRPALQEVALKDGYIAGTDAHALFFEKSDIKTDQEMLMSKKTVQLIQLFGKKEPLNLYHDANFFKLENSQVSITVKSTDAKYPDFLKVIPESAIRSLMVNKEELIDTVKKAVIMGDKVTHQLRVVINGSFHVESEDVFAGTEYRKEFKNYENTGPDIEIGFNASFLQKSLSLITDDQIRFHMNEANQGVIINKNILLMPIMLNSNN